jgi:uncharacterized protein YhfF
MVRKEMSLQTLEEFWQAFLHDLPPDLPHPLEMYPVWYFGDSPALANELGSLVKKGLKQATSTLLVEMEMEGEAVPEAGQRSLITNFEGVPLCIIEVILVEIKPFNLVTADFAYAEGEGDRSLESWRAEHHRYFSRRCAVLGLKFSEELPVVCERFRLVYP